MSTGLQQLIQEARIRKQEKIARMQQAQELVDSISEAQEALVDVSTRVAQDLQKAQEELAKFQPVVVVAPVVHPESPELPQARQPVVARRPFVQFVKW